MNSIRKVGVLGAGTMGRGIAQVCVQSGCDVVLHDVSGSVLEQARTAIHAGLAKAVEKGRLTPETKTAACDRLHTTSDLTLVHIADCVIEAVPEKLALKQELFAELDQQLAPQAILATNTSSLSITAIAEATSRPERVIGLHFFNPVPVMKLLEIIRGKQTSATVLQQALEFGKHLGKETIVVQDSPGFATSRLGLALGLEAMRMMETGVASAQDIDRAMELGYNHPIGPLKLTDLVGLDVRLSIAEYLFDKLGSESFRPPQILRDLVADGKLGKKSGQGFYLWNTE
ncbi:MAG TPA: 3-hydroxyacyl-CoA dehydrogenase family protein [Acidobacteriota bacterium]|nr:3-hydroxyacyl-CoA dehydrogenase family protein [Acidobacteriota bacterium]